MGYCLKYIILSECVKYKSTALFKKIDLREANGGNIQHRGYANVNMMTHHLIKK